MTANKKIILLALIFLLSAGSSVLTAAEETAALSENYAERVPARFGHGFMNTVFGWTELGIAPYRTLQNGGTRGDAFGRALTQPFATTFLGVWDLGTFWVPGETGRSMAVPRHVWMAPERPAAVIPAAAPDAQEEAPESNDAAAAPLPAKQV